MLLWYHDAGPALRGGENVCLSVCVVASAAFWLTFCLSAIVPLFEDDRLFDSELSALSIQMDLHLFFLNMQENLNELFSFVSPFYLRMHHSHITVIVFSQQPFCMLFTHHGKICTNSVHFNRLS